MNEADYKTEFRRAFLLADLPEPLTRASEHLQLFDNYIKDTRLRLRYIRFPQTKQWSRFLEKRFPAVGNDLRIWKTSSIDLNEEEYQAFERFEGREIRKNRYFYETNGKVFEIDVYLGDLWGLCVAKVFFETTEEMDAFEKPEIALTEITDNFFLTDENLVGRNFAYVQAEWQKGE